MHISFEFAPAQFSRSIHLISLAERCHVSHMAAHEAKNSTNPGLSYRKSEITAVRYKLRGNAPSNKTIKILSVNVIISNSKLSFVLIFQSNLMWVVRDDYQIRQKYSQCSGWLGDAFSTISFPISFSSTLLALILLKYDLFFSSILLPTNRLP